MNKSSGFSLVELLAALLLAGLITTGLMTHYLHVKQHYNYMMIQVEESIELQLVIDLIRDSTRQAGFTPCQGVDELVTGEKRQLRALSVSTSSVQINHMSEYFEPVLHVINPAQLLTPQSQILHPEDKVLIADCYHAEVKKIRDIHLAGHQQIISLDRELTFTYNEPIYIGEWLEETYFIQSKPDQKPALYYHFKHTEELTQIIYNFSAHFVAQRHYKLLQLTLELANARKIDIETQVRVR